MNIIRSAVIAALMLLCGCGGRSGLEVNQGTVYYDIQGATEGELALQLNEKGSPWSDGQSYASTTVWNITWDFDPECAPWRCRAGSFRVTVDVTTRLPRWKHADDVPAEPAGKWNTFMQKLIEHENGHRDRAIAAGAELLAAGRSMPGASGAEELEKQVNAVMRRKMIELDAGQDEYDRITKHGVAQGAVFP